MNEHVCPRCGKPCIEVKDWGKSGMLFVHVLFTEKGMEHQDAHHISRAEIEQGLTWTI